MSSLYLEHFRLSEAPFGITPNGKFFFEGQARGAILESSARLLKSGGRLVYATCSVLPQENEAIAEAFSLKHPDFVPMDAGELLAQLKVPEAASLCTGGDTASRYLRLWPHRHQTDGFFAAVWQRR